MTVIVVGMANGREPPFTRYIVNTRRVDTRSILTDTSIPTRLFYFALYIYLNSLSSGQFHLSSLQYLILSLVFADLSSRVSE
jgi:hypothetical protein